MLSVKRRKMKDRKELKEERRKEKETVLRFLKNHKGKAFTREEIREKTGYEPIIDIINIWDKGRIERNGDYYYYAYNWDGFFLCLCIGVLFGLFTLFIYYTFL